MQVRAVFARVMRLPFGLFALFWTAVFAGIGILASLFASLGTYMIASMVTILGLALVLMARDRYLRRP